MADRIRGTYPGGPRKREDDDGGEERRRVSLESAEEMEDRSHRGRRRLERRRRRRRLVVGFVLVLLVAGGAGFWLGIQGNRTSEEIAREGEASSEQGFDLSRERNVILQQLWLMEDLERAR